MGVVMEGGAGEEGSMEWAATVGHAEEEGMGVAHKAREKRAADEEEAEKKEEGRGGSRV